MRILVTGITGYVGGELAPRLEAEGHDVVGLARDPRRARGGHEVFRGDVVSGEGLPEALDGVEVAYYLVHSMETSADGSFSDRELRSARNFGEAAREAGVERIVYLGGLVPDDHAASMHLASRLAVEEALFETVPGSVALRASIVIAARSRSFRFLVRLVERMPVLPLPPWRDFSTRPVDGRDVMAALVAAGSVAEAAGRSLDVAGPDTVTYGELIDRIRDAMLVGRPGLRLPVSVTPIAARVAAVIAGEDAELIRPLMEGLAGDLLPRDEEAAELLGIRMHRLDAAIERALREWEAREPLAAR